MTIKSDKWIKKMSQEHNMIEPFEAGQVKVINNQKLYLMELQVMVMMYVVQMSLKYLQI